MDSVRALRSCSSCCCRVFHCFPLVSHASTQNSAFRPSKSKLVTLWSVSRTYPLQMNCTDSCDRGPGGISSEDFPSKARSAFVHNAIVRSLSYGEVTCHRPWTVPFVSQYLKSSQKTSIMTIELPDKMYPTILCKVKCPMIRPQRYKLP